LTKPYLGEHAYITALADKPYKRPQIESQVPWHDYKSNHIVAFYLFSIYDQHPPQHRLEISMRTNNMASLSLQKQTNRHTAILNSHEDIFGQHHPVIFSPLRMNPINYELHYEDLLHPVEYDGNPNPEPVDIILTPSAGSSDTPKSQSSPAELNPPRVTFLSEMQSQANKVQQTPPAIPPKNPRRDVKKSNWFLRFIEKVTQKLDSLTGDIRKKAKSTKKSKDHRSRPAIPRSSGIGHGGVDYTDTHTAYIMAAGLTGALCAGTEAVCGGNCGC
jgi:hypothetical protein